ncbi:MAG: hypothetical protein GTO45_03060 [Candidatus Aminicenantes bacterium]|nr:hypothetical protein [Candidatus Aminicenantes bacterium]NIM77706.1 hypothetical protein [Candidatus Aminicenantes bacterium]NIN17019.1 hypothetical protein [Candidatus Aminicenantes bacterium]NIN40912.1 hypothetical protein [Candidatus Aminicenantes bacterium]NIN83717.1 hypothetical protein [Candidatus Aminicenantes bacterium]
MSRSTACCLLGAGYSFVAGLPLAKDIFDTDVIVFSQGAEERFDKVWEDYTTWREKNPSLASELYLVELFEGDLDLTRPPFSWAVELVAAVLATPRGDDAKGILGRYHGRITQSSWCSLHVYFFSNILRLFGDSSVVTTNYDLLIERSLRHRPMKRVFGPGFYYGGIERPQVLEGLARPFKDSQRFVQLEGALAVYKLHGSLNWSIEKGRIRMYQDMRPAFRHGGTAAIVPPIPEKKAPPWLLTIWKAAEQELSSADVWIVCGYSLPDYDRSIHELLANAAGSAKKRIFIMDPLSEDLATKFQRIASFAEVIPLRGLPEGVEDLFETIKCPEVIDSTAK